MCPLPLSFCYCMHACQLVRVHISIGERNARRGVLYEFYFPAIALSHLKYLGAVQKHMLAAAVTSSSVAGRGTVA